MDKHRITKYTYLAAQLLGLAILGITLNMVLNSTSRKSGIFELTYENNVLRRDFPDILQTIEAKATKVIASQVAKATSVVASVTENISDKLSIPVRVGTAAGCLRIAGSWHCHETNVFIHVATITAGCLFLSSVLSGIKVVRQGATPSITVAALTFRITGWALSIAVLGFSVLGYGVGQQLQRVGGGDLRKGFAYGGAIANLIFATFLFVGDMLYHYKNLAVVENPFADHLYAQKN